VLYAIKGDKRITQLLPDVLLSQHDRSIERGAHKPVELYRDLLARSIEPGNAVIDPCAGSGPVFGAAAKLNCIATGIEIEAAAFGLCLSRLEELRARGRPSSPSEENRANGLDESDEGEEDEDELVDLDEPSEASGESAMQEF